MIDTPPNLDTPDSTRIPLDQIQYRKAALSEIIQLRHDVLIVGTNRISPAFDGDDFETTYHFGAFYQDQAYGCLSMMRADTENQTAYQLRGMATHPEFQGKGIGAKLLQTAEQQIKHDTGIPYFWCNARYGFEAFYEKLGWKVISEPFMIEGVCLHVKMEKNGKSVQ